MTVLSDFQDADRELVISLPYRVGLHVSYADDEDGERDDELEMQALEACLKEVAELKTGLSKEIAMQVLASKEKWTDWGQGVFNIEPLCDQAMRVIVQTVSTEEARSYVSMVLEVAAAVAQAYGEFGEETAPEKGFFGKAMSRIVGGFGSDKDVGHPMNISAAEDSAISRISKTLKAHL